MVWVSHRRPALAADAKAFGVNELVAGDDADREAGHGECCHACGDIVFEARNQSLDLLFYLMFQEVSPRPRQADEPQWQV